MVVFKITGGKCGPHQGIGPTWPDTVSGVRKNPAAKAAGPYVIENGLCTVMCYDYTILV
jgi:hypothetical protein